MVVVLGAVLQHSSRWSAEAFETQVLVSTPTPNPLADLNMDPATLASLDPAALFKRARTLLDQYDTPDMWNHSAQMTDKDPGDLARLHLGIKN